MIVFAKLKHLKNDTFFTVTADGKDYDYIKVSKNKFLPVPAVGGRLKGIPFTPSWFKKDIEVVVDDSRIRTRFQRFFGLNK